MQKEKHVSDLNQDETKPVATSSLGRFSLALKKKKRPGDEVKPVA